MCQTVTFKLILLQAAALQKKKVMNNIFYGLQLKLSLTNIKVEQPYNGETFSTHAHSNMCRSYTQVLCCVLYSAPLASSNPILSLLLRPIIFKTSPTDFNALCATLLD